MPDPQQVIHPNPDSPKVKEFLKEINEILARFQFKLVPIIKTTEAGILPYIYLADVVPPKKENKEKK